mmetsp:Transcript_43196/g.86675  ORF Transcript_43196/g.86675 Transcript_43196/m.86675 type:complete len:319 (-) Transcript_43196:125-1081(-)
MPSVAALGHRAPVAVALAVSLAAAALALVTISTKLHDSNSLAVSLAQITQTGDWPAAQEPRVGQVLQRLKQEHARRHPKSIGGQPLVSTETEEVARETLKGTPLGKARLTTGGGKTQQLRFTGSYGDTSYTVNAPAGDPATVFAHNSVWPAKVDPKMPYVETVHGDGTPYMEPLTVYAPPGGDVVSSIVPGTAARPPIPTRFPQLPEADNSPVDNTVYQCQPSGYMVGPVGYHCTPACKDSALWRSDYGDCSIYRRSYSGGGIKDYCGADHDIAGIPAAVACPVSCGTCGIGLCYEHDRFKKCHLSTYSTEQEDEEAA